MDFERSMACRLGRLQDETRAGFARLEAKYGGCALLEERTSRLEQRLDGRDGAPPSRLSPTAPGI